MRKVILVAMLLGLSAGEASAQRRGWVWGNRNGGFAVTPNYIGPYWNSSNSGFYSNYPYYGYSNGYYYSRYPGYYNSGYYTYNTYPGQTYYYTTPGYTTTTSGYTPQYNNSIAPAAYTSSESNNSAFVTVIVPTNEAQVWLGSSKTETQGLERRFQSPALDPNQEYTYTIKARFVRDGKEVEQTREVKVRANMTSFVDFRLPATTPAPMPEK